MVNWELAFTGGDRGRREGVEEGRWEGEGEGRRVGRGGGGPKHS